MSLCLMPAPMSFSDLCSTCLRLPCAGIREQLVQETYFIQVLVRLMDKFAFVVHGRTFLGIEAVIIIAKAFGQQDS